MFAKQTHRVRRQTHTSSCRKRQHIESRKRYIDKKSICRTGTPIAHYIRNGEPLRLDMRFALDVPDGSMGPLRDKICAARKKEKIYDKS